MSEPAARPKKPASPPEDAEVLQHGHEQITNTSSPATDSNNTKAFLSPASSNIKFETPRDKLYGRHKESQALWQAYARVQYQQQALTDEEEDFLVGGPELVLIAGASGSGKSFLIDQFGQQQQRQQRRRGAEGFFCTGKFDQLRGLQPYSAVSVAFTDLLDQILCHEKYNAMYKLPIQEAFGGSSQGTCALTDFIPSLSKILGEAGEARQEDLVQQEDEGLSGTEARNRFHYAFRQLVRAIARPDSPLILCLEDIHWADEASLDLMAALASDFANKPCLLLIGSYRDDDCPGSCHKDNPGHVLAAQIREMERRNVPITRIQVCNLKQPVVNELIADSLRRSSEVTQSLTDVVYDKTHGNPLSVVQLMSYLCDERLLQCSSSLDDKDNDKSWHWDTKQIRSHDVMASDDMTEFVAQKIVKLQPEVREVLQMAAGIGSSFDYLTLKLIVRYKDMIGGKVTGLFETLQVAMDEGLIVRKGKISYRFAHDRYQEAAYSLIPPKERPLLHLQLGRILINKTSLKDPVSPLGGTNLTLSHRPSMRWKMVTSEALGDFLDRVLFVAVDQLDRGSECIVTLEERVELARLNLRAAKRAIKSAAFVPAEQYLESGISLLSIDNMLWTDKHYDLTLQFYSSLAEMKYCNGSFDRALELVDVVVSHAKCLLDKLPVLSVSIRSRGVQDVQDAIDTGLDVLERLGEPFPKVAASTVIAKDMLKTKMMLMGKSDGMLCNLPLMIDRLKITAMQVLSSMFSFTYMCRPQLVPLLTNRMMQLTITYGCCNESTFAFAMYALMLSGVMDDYKAGYRFSQLSLYLIGRLNAKEQLAHVYGVVYSCCTHWQEHVHLSIDPLLLAHHQGLVVGDIEYAYWCSYFACKASFFCGRPLSVLEQDMRGTCMLVKDCGQENQLVSLSTWWQAVLNLQGRSSRVLVLSGEAMDQEKVLREASESKNSFLIAIINVNRLALAYMFGDYVLAAEMAEASRNIQSVAPGVFEVIYGTFFDGLTSCALISHSISSERKARATVRICMTKMKKWARATPDNCLHKYLLLKAEFAAVSGRKRKALETYKRAVTASAHSGYIQDEALAFERLGRFVYGEGNQDTASRYLARAHQLYLSWGALAKANILESEFEWYIERAKCDESFQGFRDRLKLRMGRAPVVKRPSNKIAVPMKLLSQRKINSDDRFMANKDHTSNTDFSSSTTAQMAVNQYQSRYRSQFFHTFDLDELIPETVAEEGRSWRSAF